MAIHSQHDFRVLGRLDFASEIFAGVETPLTGELCVGMTAGRWSVIDVVRCLPEIFGPVDCLTIMSWRMSHIDVKELYGMVRLGQFGRARLVVSHEMRGIERNVFEAVSELAGDNLRVCRSHLKGIMATGPWGNLAYMTSANFNRNARNESFELHLGGPVADAYAEFADLVFAKQPPREWEKDNAAGSKLYKRLFVEMRLATPITAGESRTDKARRVAAASDAMDELDDMADTVTLPVLVGAMRRLANSRLGRDFRQAIVPSLQEMDKNPDEYRRKIRTGSNSRRNRGR